MPSGRAFADTLLGGVSVSQGRYDETAALFVASEAYFRGNEPYLRDAGRHDFLGHARFHLDLIAWVQGDDARAQSATRLDPLRYLGLIACAAGDRNEAIMWFREEWMRRRQPGSRAALTVDPADVATLAAPRESWQPAVRLFAKAEALLQTEGAAFSLPARDLFELTERKPT